MTAPVAHHPGAAAPAADGPFAAARELLERELAARHARDGGPGLAPPGVVPLGTSDVLHPGRDPWAAHRPAATVHLTADAVLLGPWRPAAAEGAGPRACGWCLATRWQRLRGHAERAMLEDGGRPAGGGGWPALTPYAVDAVWLALRALPHARPAAEPQLPQITRIDLATLLPGTVPLLPDARCPHCVQRRRDTAKSAWMELRSAPEAAPAGSRTRPLEELELPAAALANPVCGVLGDAARTDLLGTTTVPVGGGLLVQGRHGREEFDWRGQGDSPAAGRRLALLAGLERAAARRQARGTAPVSGSYHELVWREGRHAVLDPRGCGEYPPRARQDDPDLRPFDPDRILPWVWGHSLRAGRPVLVPVALVQHGPGGDAGVTASAGGCAIGSRLEEAILHGLLELIEHDALLVAWYGRLRLPRIDPAAGTGPAVRALLDRAELYGYRVTVLDNRVDLPVPVITAVAARRDGGPGALAFGSAAGFEPGRTLLNALSQALGRMPRLPGRVAARRADLAGLAADFGTVRHPRDHALLYGLPEMTRHAAEYLRPAPARPMAEVFADWAARRPGTGDLLDDLHMVRDALAGAGHDVLAVDLTTPGLRGMGLRGVATVVPGLLPLDFGWHRQRAPWLPRLASALRGHPVAAATRLPYPAPHPFG